MNPICLLQSGLGLGRVHVTIFMELDLLLEEVVVMVVEVMVVVKVLVVVQSRPDEPSNMPP